jgi:hypothetical protein
VWVGNQVGVAFGRKTEKEWVFIPN